MVEPHFKMLWRESIPNYTQRDMNQKKTVVEIIAGKLNNMKAPAPPPDSWAADEKNEVAVWNIKMQAGAVFTLPKASVGINRTVYVYEGSNLKLAGTTVLKYNAAELNEDYHMTQFGGWPWPKYDQVHPCDKTRFAKHADGKMEIKSA